MKLVGRLQKRPFTVNCMKKAGDAQVEGDLGIALNSRNPECRRRETYIISGCSGQLS